MLLQLQETSRMNFILTSLFKLVEKLFLFFLDFNVFYFKIGDNFCTGAYWVLLG